MAEVRLSKKWTLQWADVARGGVVAVFSAVGSTIYQVANDSLIKGIPIVINWENVLNVGLLAGIAYIAKNFGWEPAKVIVTAKTNQKAENANEKIVDVVTQP